MRRMTMLMEEEEKVALDEIARRVYRNPREVLRLLLREAACKRGLLPPINAEDRALVYATGQELEHETS